MCKPNIKLRRRDLEYMNYEQLNELLRDEIWFSDPKNSEYPGQHSSNVITIRQYMSEMMHRVNF